MGLCTGRKVYGSVLSGGGGGGRGGGLGNCIGMKVACHQFIFLAFTLARSCVCYAKTCSVNFLLYLYLSSVCRYGQMFLISSDL